MDSGPSGSIPSTSSSIVHFAQPAGVIRRRRFSTAKIQPTRIKKVMQSDEDIGRMVQSVPVAIGRAMEHFAEKFLQAAALATQSSSSKTLSPQHMKQAILMTPYFQFLEPLFKDVQVPGNLGEMVKIKQECNFAEQQQFLEQQKQELANSLLQTSSPVTPSPLNIGWTSMSASLGNLPPFTFFPIEQKAPPTPTEEVKINGKRTSTDQDIEPDKPKRGRPRKKKNEKCIDDDLFVEASENVEKEERDREIMPPPSLPAGISIRRST